MASSSCWAPPYPIVYPARLTRGWTPLYTGRERGAGWVEGVLRWSTEIVGHPPKPAPEGVMLGWAKAWAKGGVPMDPKGFLPPEGPRTLLPRRWVVERAFSWLGQNRRMGKDYERPPETGEALIYAAMGRLMAGRLARR